MGAQALAVLSQSHGRAHSGGDGRSPRTTPKPHTHNRENAAAAAAGIDLRSGAAARA
ncbi:hypothetical protein ACP70R_048139 [Stipagrostis hirtigluma subsp. patula]